MDFGRTQRSPRRTYACFVTDYDDDELLKYKLNYALIVIIKVSLTDNVYTQKFKQKSFK